MAVDLPDQVGRYRIQAVIGTGGFATVYRAVDERLDAVVAVKVLAENHAHDPDLRERFLKEGQVLRRIDGPHVVTVHDLGETERGQPYLVLDYADRGNLAERAASRRAAGWRPQIADLLHVAETVADALAAVHASSLVHRDVAPRNLLVRSARVAGTRSGCGLVDADEQLVLADLGLSKDLQTASGLTVGGGTAGYTPPEQRTGLAKVGAAADIWAATALLVWLLLDRPPDDDGHWQQELVAAGWPEALTGVATRGLAWEPADRYGDAPAWFAAVRDAVLPTTVLTPSPVVAAGPVGATGVVAAGWPAGAAGADASSGMWGPSNRPDGPADPLLATTEVAGAPGPTPDLPDARSGVWRRARWLVAVSLGVVLGAGGLSLVREGDEPQRAPDQTEEELADGRIRVEASDGGRSVAIVGPARLEVGQEEVFEADLDEEMQSSVWIGPDGELHPDEDRLEVEASSAGELTVTLVGIGDGGRTVVAVRALQVDDTGSS